MLPTDLEVLNDSLFVISRMKVFKLSLAEESFGKFMSIVHGGQGMQGVQRYLAHAITVHDERLYVASWRYILVYSPDDVLWQTVELPDGHLLDAFQARNDEGSLFQVPYWSPKSICVNDKHVYVQDHQRMYILTLNVVQPSSAAGSSSS